MWVGECLCVHPFCCLYTEAWNSSIYWSLERLSRYLLNSLLHDSNQSSEWYKTAYGNETKCEEPTVLTDTGFGMDNSTGSSLNAAGFSIT